MGRAQAVTNHESLFEKEAEVVRLEGDTASRLLIKKSRQLDGGCAPSKKVADEELAGNSGLDQGFDQENMLAADFRVGTEEDFRGGRFALNSLLEFGADELADDRH